MLGKTSSLISYIKNLEVYVIKRYPSNKLPMFGIIFTYLTAFYILNRMSLTMKINYLKNMRLAKDGKSCCACPCWTKKITKCDGGKCPFAPKS